LTQRILHAIRFHFDGGQLGFGVIPLQKMIVHGATRIETARLRFTMRGLLLLTAVCAIVTAFCVFVYDTRRRQAGYGPCATFDEWPRALVQLIGENKTLQRDVEPYGLGRFFDGRSIWRIRAGSPLRDALFDNNDLQATDVNHPKASELMGSLPNTWGKYQWNHCTWHATPGYGTTHTEGLDLYLVADDPESKDVIVLHEWIF
jgi:hypothetical protein